MAVVWLQPTSYTRVGSYSTRQFTRERKPTVGNAKLSLQGLLESYLKSIVP